MNTDVAFRENKHDSGVPMLALRPKEAALALGISERLLWAKTNAGEIPCIRVGRRVVYPVDQLRDWMARQTKPPNK